ncbi:hypothetical protein [Sorangium sp. So ce1024]|uniref:hypothetical protein n=1 Tax=Sorangium sp. So ce1024 TaxID=3133327 RepID=UPI003EFED4A5
MDATCTKVRAEMLRETDGIAMKNLAVGAIFAAVAAGLSTASGIYNLAEGEDASPTVSAILGLGAGASTVPTFFYFGSDERQKVVQDRMKSIDERREQVNRTWQSFKAQNREFSSLSADLREATKNYEQAKAPDDQCTFAPPDTLKQQQCESAKKNLENVTGRYRASIAAWHQAADSIDDAVTALADACK